MRTALFLLFYVVGALANTGIPSRLANDIRAKTRALLLDPTCKAIQAAISPASAVFAPGTAEYEAQIGE
jgi:hypothetical protein